MTLASLRRRAAFGGWVEFFARAFSPSCGILLVYVTAALFGFGSPWAFAAALALSIAALAFAMRNLRRPAGEEIDRRIERKSGLRHRPIAMLEDSPENESAISALLWQLHQRRVALSLQTARAGMPQIGAAARDPYALRGFLLLLLLAGAIIAGPDSLNRLGQAFALPVWHFARPTIDAWITPPAYTGAPPLVLTHGEAPVILAGSQLTLVVNGQAHPVADLGNTAIHFAGQAQNSFRADAVLRASAMLRIGPWWHRLARWNLTVTAPLPPSLRMRKPLVEGHALRISWQAQDSYGLTSLNATLTPVGHAHALPERFALPLDTPNLKDASGIAAPDIGDSPYAGLQVAVVLAAGNLAGLTGLAGPMNVRLPPSALRDRTALALAALRQTLALEPADQQRVGDALTSLAQAPPSQISGAADLQMAMLGRQLSREQIAAGPAQEILGRLVRQVEQGLDYEPARALAAVSQQLEQALRQAIASGGKLDDSRLQSLLSALHDALARHMQALGSGARAAGTPSVNTDAIDQLAEQIAKDEAAGQSAKAGAELNQLEKILSALQSARPMTADQARRATAASQAAQALSGLMKGEASLLDRTNQGAASASDQAALRQQLAAVRQGLTQAGVSLPAPGNAGLRNASAAMSTAQSALAAQQTGMAATAEGAAIQALQQAAAALAASQSTIFGESGAPSQGGGDDGQGLYGAPDENSTTNPLPSSNNAAAAIQQQIIKNDDDPRLPSAVHQYYHKLLDPNQP